MDDSLPHHGAHMGAENQGYCVKCKAKRDMANVTRVTMANGRPALKGQCPVCGTGMFKILATPKAS